MVVIDELMKIVVILMADYSSGWEWCKIKEGNVWERADYVLRRVIALRDCKFTTFLPSEKSL